MGTNPSPRVAIALDATKDLNQRELSATISNVRARGDILVNGDTLVVLGILAKVTLPLGYQSKASLLSTSETSIRAMHEEISKKVDTYVRMLQQSAQDCERQGVRVEVKIIGGASTKDIVIKEAASCKAVILDRKLRQDLQFYLDKIPCKEVTSFQDSIVLEILRADAQREADITAIKKLFYIYYKARPVLQSNFQANNTNEDLRKIKILLTYERILQKRKQDTIQTGCFPKRKAYSDEELLNVVLPLVFDELEKIKPETWKEIGWFRRKVIAFRVVLKAQRLRKEKLRHASKMKFA
ncbi:hypothetical protein V6Z11_D02G090500 [Gossypium hirsutum]|uniref:Uncharacterized protein isoform X1 n=1 Tax=Gossypium hirsutum TaxID=3635 RepID=A0A1U8JTZ6_GOSHI|nr:uncharacterized protein LOC107910400 isoform X1 [Gossypium hirsutum]